LIGSHIRKTSPSLASATRPDAQADLVSNPIQSKIQRWVTLRELRIAVEMGHERPVGGHHEIGLPLDYNLPHERRCL